VRGERERDFDLDFLRGAGASGLVGRARGFTDGDLDFDADALPDELAEPELLDALDDRDEVPLLDDLDRLPDELSLPLLLLELLSRAFACFLFLSTLLLLAGAIFIN
jgi:hypothetical protein